MCDSICFIVLFRHEHFFSRLVYCFLALLVTSHNQTNELILFVGALVLVCRFVPVCSQYIMDSAKRRGVYLCVDCITRPKQNLKSIYLNYPPSHNTAHGWNVCVWCRTGYQFNVLFEIVDGRMKTTTYICSPLPLLRHISNTNRTSGQVYCVKGFCHFVIWAGSLYFILPIQWQLHWKQLYDWRLQMHTNSVPDISYKRQIISINIIALGTHHITSKYEWVCWTRSHTQFPNMRWVSCFFCSFLCVEFRFCGMNGLEQLTRVANQLDNGNNLCRTHIIH